MLGLGLRVLLRFGSGVLLVTSPTSYGEIWGDVERYGEMWRDMGEIWGDMHLARELAHELVERAAP